MMNADRNWIGESEGKRLFENFGHGLEDNAEMEFK
jgi:hypothetical protein